MNEMRGHLIGDEHFCSFAGRVKGLRYNRDFYVGIRAMIARLSMLVFMLFSAYVSAQECHRTPGWDSMRIGKINLEKAGQVFSLTVRVADNDTERTAGYQWSCEADARDTAVLFIFPKMLNGAFHMRHVYIPLEIYFFDEVGKQVDAMVMRAEPPGQGVEPSLYRPAASFRYALEIARPTDYEVTSSLVPMRLVLH